MKTVTWRGKKYDVSPTARLAVADHLGYVYCSGCVDDGSGRLPFDVFDGGSSPWREEKCEACGIPFNGRAT